MAPKQPISISLDGATKCLAFDVIAALSGVEYLLALGLKRALQQQDVRFTLGHGLAWADLARGRKRLWKEFEKELKVCKGGTIDATTRDQVKSLRKEHMRLGQVRDELAHGVFIRPAGKSTRLLPSFARQGKPAPSGAISQIDLTTAATEAQALFRSIHQFIDNHLPV